MRWTPASLASKRENCGDVSEFTPGKKAKLEEFMEKREAAAHATRDGRAHGLRSYHGQAVPCARGLGETARGRQDALTVDHMKELMAWCEKNFENQNGRRHVG